MTEETTATQDTGGTEQNGKKTKIRVSWEDVCKARQKMWSGLKEMYQLIIITIALGAVAVLIMWGVNGWNPLEGSPVSSSIWESFFAVFGLMYTIIAGLFLVESCRRRNQLSSIITSEVNALGDIHDCLRFFGDDDDNPAVKKKIVKELRKYVKLMGKDWVAMEDPGDERLEAFPKRDKGIRPVIEHVCELTASNKSDEHALGIICDRVCDITTYRTDRRDLAQHGLSSGLYLLIPFMSVVIWVATLLLPVANDWVHGFIVFGTTVALISLFLLLADADHPFSGLFCIRKEILNDIRRKLRRRVTGKQ